MLVETIGDYGAYYYPDTERGPRSCGPALPGPDYAPGLVAELVYRRAASIYGGTDEIQRNIIAQDHLRVLSRGGHAISRSPRNSACILESAAAFAPGATTSRRRRKRVARARRFDRDLWAEFADDGLARRRDRRGTGRLRRHRTDRDQRSSPRTSGRAQVLDPYVMCGVFPPAHPRRRRHASAQAAQDAIASARRCSPLPIASPPRRACLPRRPRDGDPHGGDGWILDGHKSLVVGAPECDAMIVSARTAGDAGDDTRRHRSSSSIPRPASRSKATS